MDKMRLHTTIDKELYEYLRKESEKRLLDINELLEQIIEHYQSCKVKEKEETKQASLKLIVTKYNGKCSKCGSEISIGSLAYFGKGDRGETILICLDCMIQNKSDKALASRYLKMRELDKTVKALRKEAEALAEKLEDLQIVQKFDNIHHKNDEAIKLIMDYLKNPFVKEEERKILEDWIRQLEENKRIVRDVEQFIQSRLRPIKKLKQSQRERDYEV